MPDAERFAANKCLAIVELGRRCGREFTGSCYNGDMVILEMLQWWYQRGWKIFLGKFSNQLKNAADFFSIRLLVTSLFAPFRQISAGELTSSSLSARMTAFFDRLFSRLIGAIVRLILLIIGIVVIVLQAVFGVVAMILWPLVPFAVVGCVVLAVVGVTL